MHGLLFWVVYKASTYSLINLLCRYIWSNSEQSTSFKRNVNISLILEKHSVAQFYVL